MITLINGRVNTNDVSVFPSATFQPYPSVLDAACFFCAPCRNRRFTTLKNCDSPQDPKVPALPQVKSLLWRVSFCLKFFGYRTSLKTSLQFTLNLFLKLEWAEPFWLVPIA